MVVHKRVITFFVVVIVVMIVLHRTGKLNWLDRAVGHVVNPVVHFVYQQNMRVHDALSLIKEKQALIDALSVSQGATADMQHLQVTNAELLRENMELKNQLRFFRVRKELKWVTCDVIGKNLEEHTTGFILDCGDDQAIKNGQAVVTGEGVLIGKVISVKPSTAIVRLLDDAKSRVLASALNSDTSIGIVEGNFGIGLTLDFVPQNEKLTPGDVVITSGREEGVPRGLIIGSVEAVTRREQQPFQQAVVQPPLDYDKILIASVIVEQ